MLFKSFSDGKLEFEKKKKKGIVILILEWESKILERQEFCNLKRALSTIVGS